MESPQLYRCRGSVTILNKKIFEQQKVNEQNSLVAVRVFIFGLRSQWIYLPLNLDK